MADSQYNLSLVITANNKAVEELNKVWKSVEKVKWNVLQLSESTKQTLKTVWVTATAVAWSVVALWKSFVDSAMKVEPLERSFVRLSESVWVASDEMLSAMKKASRWTVSDLKLMEAANTAYSLWVVKSTDDMTTLMEIARVKWQAMWRSMEEALDDIVRGLWRSSPLILDNLWIVVKLWEAHEAYARQIWKSVNELTEAEKKQALVNYVVAQGKRELEEAWELQLTMAERLQIVNAQRENMKTTIWEALIPVVEKVLTILTPLLDKIVERVNEHPDLTANILLTVWAVSWLIAVLSWLALALPWITTMIWALTGPLWLVLAWITALWVARAKDWWWIRETTAEAIDTISWILSPRFDKIEARRREHGETVLIYVKEVFWAVAETIWTSLWLAATTASVALTWIDSSFKLLNAAYKWDGEEMANITMDRSQKVDSILTENLWSTRTTIKTGLQNAFDRVVVKFTELYLKVKEIVDKIKSARSSATSKISNVASNVKSSVSNFISWKASGWTVYAWTPYLVWENGPELFVPSQRWSITPNNQITNNNGIEINMNWFVVRSEADINSIAKEVVRQIKLEKNFWIA